MMEATRLYEVTAPSTGDAWIAPDGRFFAVGFNQHVISLIAIYEDEFGEYRGALAVRELEDDGWIHVEHDGHIDCRRYKAGLHEWGSLITQAQLNTLHDILQAHRENPNSAPHYLTNVQSFIRESEVE